MIDEKQSAKGNQKDRIQKEIEKRANHHLQKMHLEQLNKQLQAHKKKTKLLQLDQKCKKLIHSKVEVNCLKPTLEAVRKFQKKALNQVKQIENIIQTIQNKKKVNRDKKQHRNQETLFTQKKFVEVEEKDWTILFRYSSEELLSMQYLPI